MRKAISARLSIAEQRCAVARDRSSQMSIAPRSSSCSGSAGTSCQLSIRRRAPREALHSRSVSDCRPTGSSRTSTLALPLSSPTARFGPRGRTPTWRSSSPRPSTTAARWPTRTSRLLSSQSAPVTGCSRELRRASEESLRGTRRRATVGRLLNNLGGLSLLLGKPERAIEQLKASFAVAVEADSQADAGQAVNGLATVYLRLGDWDAARRTRARRCVCSRAAKTFSTRSARPSSCWAARCSSATVSTRPRRLSAPPIRHSNSSHRSVTVPAPGWRSATSPRAAVRTRRRQALPERR